MVYNSHTTKIYPLKVYSSVGFGVFTKLYDHQHYLILEQFQSPRKKLEPRSAVFMLSAASPWQP